jgi:type I restriction enzyme R subunit
LEQLLALVAQNEQRLRQQAEIGFDGLTYFVYRSLLDAQISNAEAVSATIKAAFVAHPNWRSSEKALRELRQKVTFALVAECDTLEPVTPIVDELFSLLAKADRIGANQLASGPYGLA